MTAERHFTADEARAAGDRIGIDWNAARFDVEQFRMGMDVELEHGSRDAATDVTGDDVDITAKIARAHLNEFPDYYSRLAVMEADAESVLGSPRAIAATRADRRGLAVHREQCAAAGYRIGSIRRQTRSARSRIRRRAALTDIGAKDLLADREEHCVDILGYQRELLGKASSHVRLRHSGREDRAHPVVGLDPSHRTSAKHPMAQPSQSFCNARRGTHPLPRRWAFGALRQQQPAVLETRT